MSGRSGGDGGSSGGGTGSHSSVQLDSNITEDTKGLLGGGVDSEDHSLSTVSASPLFAVPPGGIH